MSDDDKIECECCGEYFDELGIGAHHPSWDEVIEETSQPDCDVTLKARVRAGDGGACVPCGATESYTIHIVGPDVGSERVANDLTLSATCDKVDRLCPRTKRSKVHSDR